MSIVANALKEIENEQFCIADRQAGEVTTKAMRSASFIVTTSRILKPIAENLLRTAVEDLQREGYTAKYFYNEFSFHIAAGVALCPKHGDIPKDIHGLECGMGQAFNTGSFLIRVESNSKLSITGQRSNRSRENCIDVTTTLADLSESKVAHLLETYLVAVLCPKTQI